MIDESKASVLSDAQFRAHLENWNVDEDVEIPSRLMSWICARYAEARQASAWQTIESAPKDGTKVDLWAKTWAPAFDRFEYRRFADCWWWKGDSLGNSSPQWMELSKDWRPTHWMPIPVLEDDAHE